MTDQTEPPPGEAPDYKSFLMFWTDGSMTSAPNITDSSLVSPTVFRLATPTGEQMFVNVDKTFRIEVYDQDGPVDEGDFE